MDTPNLKNNANQHPTIDKYMEVSIDDLLDINGDDLSTEYARQASRYATFATRLAQLNHAVSRAKAQYEQEQAEADTYWRSDFANRGAKFTENVIHSHVTVDAVVVAAEEQYHAAIAERDYIKAIVEALQMRADMLISLGATQRHEMSMTGMQINETSELKRLKDIVTTAQRNAENGKNQP